MAIGIVIVAIAALAVVALVAWPLLQNRPDAPADPAADERQEVDARLEASLQAIREIEMDHRAGNLSDADFAELDQAERAKAVELMRQSDALAEASKTVANSGEEGPSGTSKA